MSTSIGRTTGQTYSTITVCLRSSALGIMTHTHTNKRTTVCLRPRHNNGNLWFTNSYFSEGAGEENESLPIGEEFICLFDSAFVGGCSERQRSLSPWDCCWKLFCLVNLAFPFSLIFCLHYNYFALEKKKIFNKKKQQKKLKIELGK